VSVNRLVASGWVKESVVVIAARGGGGGDCDSETKENTHIR